MEQFFSDYGFLLAALTILGVMVTTGLLIKSGMKKEVYDTSGETSQQTANRLARIRRNAE